MTRTFTSLILVLALCLGAMASPAVAQNNNKPSWKALDEALTASSYSRQHVVVDIYAPWCGWCERIEEDVHSKDEVRQFLEDNFELARVDLSDERSTFSYKDEELTSAELASRFNATGTPTTVFLAPDGSYITRLPGYVESEIYLLVLQFIKEEAYREMAFPEYQQQHM